MRVALAAGVVAGLIVIAACTDGGGGKTVTAPQQAPRMDNIPTGGFNTAKQVILCVDNSSPAGVYTFVNTQLNRNRSGLPAGSGNPADGLGIALPGNGAADGTDGASGGNGTTVANEEEGVTYTVTRNTAGNPHGIGVGNCVLLLNRTSGTTQYMDKLPISHGGNCEPATTACGGINDIFAAVTFNYTGTSTVAGGANYSKTDCLLDDGVLVPEQSNPPASFFDVNFPHGSIPPTYNSAPPPNPGPYVCDNHNNPTRAFANFEHGVVVTFFLVPAPILEPCVLGYPYTDNSRTNVDFNESEVLTGFQLIGTSLHGWYTDEHALTLGVDSIFIKNKTPPPHEYYGIFNNAAYAIEKMTNNPTSATTASAIGTPLIRVGRVGTASPPVGLGNAIDPAGRPLFPALYITDITGLADNASNTSADIRAGDWQYSTGIGIPNIPSAVYGTWKAAVLTIDNTGKVPVTKLVNRADPAKNHKVVGTGGVNPLPAAIDLGYSSDIVWDIANLHDEVGDPLQVGNRYRAQFIVHDGDQNKSGGDTGQACVNLTR